MSPNPAFQVAAPGLITTVQDLGRPGYMQFGIPGGGAMDTDALQVGNLLVGNSRGAAVLEFPLRGPALVALKDVTVALCGASMSATIDGKPAPMWKTVPLRKGQRLEYAMATSGVWGYLAVAGGIHVNEALGSRSTFLRANIGGLNGRALAAGDILESDPPLRPPEDQKTRALGFSAIPKYERNVIARVVLGPQDDAFTESALRTFTTTEYAVTGQSDRMGYRLRGEKLTHRERADIISDAVAPGSIQIPPDGQPIVLLADRQTTGGYTKIATVISADIPKLVQVPTGGKIAFRAIGVELANSLAVMREEMIKTLERGCA